MSAGPFSAAIFLAVAAFFAFDQPVLRIEAGAVGRRAPLVSWESPGAPAPRFALLPDGRCSPIQRLTEGRRFAFRLPGNLGPGGRCEVRLASARPGSCAPLWTPGPRAVAVGEDVTVSVGPVQVLRYRGEIVDPPPGYDAVFARSGYLHPLRTPGGQVVTGDFPEAHPHQHGVFMAWTRVSRGSRTLDFWNAAARSGSIRHRAVRSVFGGEWLAGFDAALVAVDPGVARDPSIVAEQSWSVRVAPRGDVACVDVLVVETAAVDLRVEPYRYGGFAWRGPETWTPASTHVLTDVSRGRAETDGMRARWCAVTRREGSRVATFAILSHGENPGHPEPVRFHPEEPYFCFAACRLGPFRLEAGVPRAVRYRIVLADREIAAGELDRMQRDFTSPVVVRVGR